MDWSKPPPSPPPPPPPTHATSAGPSAGNAATKKYAQENFRSLLMKCAISSSPTKSLTPPQKAFLEKRIQEFFPTVHTPDHPPYAWMIENAIKQLNEEGGSNEEAISKFIAEEYKDLPWAHATLLKHHLKKLSESGNLVESHDGCYLIGKAIFTLSRTSKPSPSVNCTPSPTCSLSPSLCYCSSPTYESSSTSISSQSFNLKRKGRKRKTRRNHTTRNSQRRKQNERGIIIHPKSDGQRQGRSWVHGRGRDRGRGRGRGMGRGRGGGGRRGRVWGRGRNWRFGQPCKDNMMEEVYADKVEDEMCLNHMDEVGDENTQGKEKPQARGNQDTIDVDSEAKQSPMVIEIETSEQEYSSNGDRIEPLQLETIVRKRTICSSNRESLISEQGSKKVNPKTRSTHLKHAPQTERGRCRSRKRGMQIGEDGKNMEPLEATEIGALRRKNKRKIEERGQLKESQCYLPSIDVCLIDDDNTANIQEREIEHAGPVEREEEDSMDELIEEVYVELKEAADWNLQRIEHQQAHWDQDSANIECQAEPVFMVTEVDVKPRPQEHIFCEERFIKQEDQSDGEGMQHKIHQQSAADQLTGTTDVQLEEQEKRYSDSLNEQQLRHGKSARFDGATLVLEQKHLKDDQGSWTEGQNHAQIDVQENIGATKRQIPLRGDKDEGVKGQNHTAGIENEINEKSLMDQSSEWSNVDQQKREYHVDDYFDDCQLEDNECSGNPTLKEVTQKKFQLQPLETELTLVSCESQKQESDGIEQQDQLKRGGMKIIGQNKMCEGDCHLIEKESQMKGAFEVLEERNQQIEQPEVIIGRNQPEILHCILMDREEKEYEEFEHCDELSKVERGNNEEKCPFGETQVEEHPHMQHSEDPNQLEQAVDKAEDNQPIKKSKTMGTESLKVGDNAENSQNIILTFDETSGSKIQNKRKNILGNMEHKNKYGDEKYISEQQSDMSSFKMSMKVNSVEDPSKIQSKLQWRQTMVKAQCRQLPPRPPKCQPDQTTEQFDLSNLEKSSEANQRYKLRLQPPKNEAIEVENKAESLPLGLSCESGWNWVLEEA